MIMFKEKYPSKPIFPQLTLYFCVEIKTLQYLQSKLKLMEEQLMNLLNQNSQIFTESEPQKRAFYICKRLISQKKYLHKFKKFDQETNLLYDSIKNFLKNVHQGVHQMKGNKNKLIRISHTIFELSRLYGLHLSIDPSLFYVEPQVTRCSRKAQQGKVEFQPACERLSRYQKDCVSTSVSDNSVNLFLDSLTSGKLNLEECQRPCCCSYFYEKWEIKSLEKNKFSSFVSGLEISSENYLKTLEKAVNFLRKHPNCTILLGSSITRFSNPRRFLIKPLSLSECRSIDIGFFLDEKFSESPQKVPKYTFQFVPVFQDPRFSEEVKKFSEQFILRIKFSEINDDDATQPLESEQDLNQSEKQFEKDHICRKLSLSNFPPPLPTNNITIRKFDALAAKNVQLSKVMPFKLHAIFNLSRKTQRLMTELIEQLDRKNIYYTFSKPDPQLLKIKFFSPYILYLNMEEQQFKAIMTEIDTKSIVEYWIVSKKIKINIDISRINVQKVIQFLEKSSIGENSGSIVRQIFQATSNNLSIQVQDVKQSVIIFISLLNFFITCMFL